MYNSTFYNIRIGWLPVTQFGYNHQVFDRATYNAMLEVMQTDAWVQADKNIDVDGEGHIAVIPTLYNSEREITLHWMRFNDSGTELVVTFLNESNRTVYQFDFEKWQTINVCKPNEDAILIEPFNVLLLNGHCMDEDTHQILAVLWNHIGFGGYKLEITDLDTTESLQAVANDIQYAVKASEHKKALVPLVFKGLNDIYTFNDSFMSILDTELLPTTSVLVISDTEYVGLNMYNGQEPAPDNVHYKVNNFYFKVKGE